MGNQLKHEFHQLDDIFDFESLIVLNLIGILSFEESLCELLLYIQADLLAHIHHLQSLPQKHNQIPFSGNILTL